MIGLTLGLQHSAKATIRLQLTDTSGGNSGVVTSATPTVTFTGNVGQYSVTLTAGTTNTPGTTVGRLEITNLSVSRNSLALAGDTLIISLQSSDYSNPPGSPLSLSSSGSASWTLSSTSDTVSFVSYGDASNSSSFGVGTPTGSFTITSTGGTTGSLAGNGTPTTFTRSGNYALSNITTIHLNELNSTVNTTGVTVAAAVPEPASLALAFAGVPVLGLLWTRRRQRTC